jgi:hypothetical protein
MSSEHPEKFRLVELHALVGVSADSPAYVEFKIVLMESND